MYFAGVLSSVLEVKLDGKQTNRMEFCVGDDLMLVCSIGNNGAYQWTVPGLVVGNDGLTGVGNAPVTQTAMGVTFTLEAARIDLITTRSTLTFTVSSLLDGRNITCGVVGTDASTSFSFIMVLGMRPYLKFIA